MGRRASEAPARVNVALPAWAARSLARQVTEGLFPSVEGAVAVVGPYGEGRDGRWL